MFMPGSCPQGGQKRTVKAQCEADLPEIMCMLCCSQQLSGHKNSTFKCQCGQCCQVRDFDLESKHVRNGRKLSHSISFSSVAVRKCAQKKQVERERVYFCLKFQQGYGPLHQERHSGRSVRRIYHVASAVWKFRENRNWGLAVKPQGPPSSNAFPLLHKCQVTFPSCAPAGGQVHPHEPTGDISHSSYNRVPQDYSFPNLKYHVAPPTHTPKRSDSGDLFCNAIGKPVLNQP